MRRRFGKLAGSNVQIVRIDRAARSTFTRVPLQFREFRGRSLPDAGCRTDFLQTLMVPHSVTSPIPIATHLWMHPSPERRLQHTCEGAPTLGSSDGANSKTIRCAFLQFPSA